MLLLPRLLAGLSVLALALTVPAADAPNSKPETQNPPLPRWPGKQPDGSVLLPNMWSLRPAGVQVDLADFPVNIALHPDGKLAAVLHAGYSAHEIAVVDIAKATVLNRTKVEETFYGIEFARDGKRLYASGAGSEVVRCFDFDAKAGTLGKEQEIRLRNVAERGIPAGLALTSDSQHLYVANVLGQRVAKVDLNAKTNVLDIIVGPGGTTPNSKLQTPNSIKPQTEDEAAITKRAEAALDPADPTAPYPYACRLDESRGRLYVSLWAQAQVAVIDLKSNQVIARWPTEEHPNEMLLTKNGKLLYVANANRNTVTVIDTEKGVTTETIWAALYPQ